MPKPKRKYYTRDCYESAVYDLLGITPVDVIKTLENGRDVYMFVYDSDVLPDRKDIKVTIETAGGAVSFPLLPSRDGMSYAWSHRAQIKNIRKLIEEQQNERFRTT